MISNLERLQETFSNMEADGFAINSHLKWGFYFVDENKGKLENVYELLREKDYIQENIFGIEGENVCTLHVSKVDVLTPEKLHRRNLAFNDLATYCDVEMYDGWDVEKV